MVKPAIYLENEPGGWLPEGTYLEACGAIAVQSHARKRLAVVTQKDSCCGCPWVRVGHASLNVCSRMPVVLEKDHLPKYAVNDDWRGVRPDWCPLRTESVLVEGT
jgi:hypothetical protein